MSDKDNINTVKFDWNSSTDTVGITAQEVDISAYGGANYTVTMNDTIDLGSISITNGSSAFNIGSPYTFSSGVSTNSLSGISEINTSSGKKIDLEELVDIVDTLKKRLLILAPNFEMHEKYPMLKELYDEYKALEKLLSGPDSTSGDM